MKIPTLFALLLNALFLSAASQSLTDRLTVGFFPRTEAADALFPASVSGLGPTVGMRYNTILTISTYEIAAACHPTALSFFGVKDPIDAILCTGDSPAIIQSYIAHRIYESEFPLEAAGYADYLVSLGLTPANLSTDTTTEIGFANVVAARAVKYFRNDGWNSRGGLTRATSKQPFEDTTGYKPVNLAEQAPDELERPLRWQPLTQALDGRGLFFSQVHATPHVGNTSPLSITREELRRRRVNRPFETPDRKGSISAKDTAVLEKRIDQLFALSRNHTPRTRFLAHWWNDKSISLASFFPFYVSTLKLGHFDAVVLSMAQAIAQYDAILVVWKEKVRHDLVRPITAVRRQRAGSRAELFVSEEKGVQTIDPVEWEPIIRTQPHSEFPSASSILCTASLDALRLGLERHLGPNETLPPYRANFPPNAFGFPVSRAITLEYATLEAAGRGCGFSRLLGGVHFQPAIIASRHLAVGLGKTAVDHMTELVAGRVPEVCDRCMDV